MEHEISNLEYVMLCNNGKI